MIFDPLSIFTRLRPLQLLRKAAMLPGVDCALCGAASGAELVCSRCADAMPRSRAACPRCAVPMPAAEPCGSCLRHPPRFEHARAAFEYRFPVDAMVRRFKFAGDLATGRWLAEQLAHALRDAPMPDVLVVPALSPGRLRERGFNQALEIARLVGGICGVPVDARAIAKARDTAPQPGLGGRARRANLRGAFRVTRAIGERHVALVDDVMTTGATADAIARALRSAGARRVDVWVVARTPDPRR